MEKQVFISYAGEDRHVAAGIADALEKKSIGCWIDHVDIKHGDDWISEIPEAIEKARLLVLVFSAAANRSTWVKREINHALTENKIIIPFCIENVSPQGTFKFLKSNAQRLDAASPPRPGDFESLAEAVNEKLTTMQGTPSPSHHPPAGFAANPFGDTAAVKVPGRFIERPAVMRRLMSCLDGGSVALQGVPKIGKSSLLNCLARSWAGDVLGPLDCHSLTDAGDFFGIIAGALNIVGNDRMAIRGVLEKRRILFLLDELDFAPKRGITHDDMVLFRYLCNCNHEFKIVAVSSAPLKDIFPVHGKDSGFYNVMVPFTLGPLTVVEATLLLEHPWAPDAPRFDEAVCKELIELTGRHPFKLQRAAHHRFESLADNGYDWRSGYQTEMEHML